MKFTALILAAVVATASAGTPTLSVRAPKGLGANKSHP
jgi:hypothetical protein